MYENKIIAAILTTAVTRSGPVSEELIMESYDQFLQLLQDREPGVPKALESLYESAKKL